MDFLAAQLPEKIGLLESNGDYKGAIKEIDSELESYLPSIMTRRLLWEKERILRLKDNYPYTNSQAFEILSNSIDNFTREEFEGLCEAKQLDSMTLDGEERFERRFDKNLLFVMPEYGSRLKQKDNERDEIRALLHREIDRLISTREPSKFKVNARSSINVQSSEENVFRCWLPVSRNGEQVSSTKILNTSHSYFLSPADYSQRTVYMESDAKKDTVFSVEFEYEISEISTSLDPSRCTHPDEKRFESYLIERAPHIVFSPFMRSLADEISGKETNPYYIAKSFYDWICEHVKYTFMSEYALYPNLSEFAATNLRGDCGVKALLFITLCRIKGIPARWQSGWFASPKGASPHDWALFWLEPFGWVPADCSFGGSRKDIPAYREFYFGNLDAYRMISNSEFMAPLLPAKRFFRSDPYDNQVGEIETEKRALRSYERECSIEILSFERLT
jgi:transglutaminase-like putative cysteine protease